MTSGIQETISQPIALGKILTRIRGELKMNQTDFGRFLGVSRPSISAWELSNARPMRATLSRVRGKLQPYLTPEELAVLESGAYDAPEPKSP